MTDQLRRLSNIVASLAHPRGDHRENALEDEAHDIIRELAACVDLGGVRPAPEESEEFKRPVGGSRGNPTMTESESGLTRQVPDESPGAHFEAILVEMKGMSLRWMRDAVEQYAIANGGMHDNLCPEDDTCNCSLKWMNDGVNATCRFLRALAQKAEDVCR